MLKFVCDRQGEVIEGVEKDEQPGQLLLELRKPDNQVGMQMKIDLCDDCIEVVEKIINSRILLKKSTIQTEESETNVDEN